MSFQRVAEFDTWRSGYAGATVTVLIAGTSTPADLFSNPLLTTPLDNPQVLLSRTEADGTDYGKFAQSVYVGVAYQLQITRTNEVTGQQQLFLIDLNGEDASLAEVITARGTVARQLEDALDDEVWLEAFGTLGASPTANTTILNAAIGAAAGQSGGRVMLPAGSWEFTQFTLPQDVVLVGHGRGATTLRSSQANAVCTIGGDGAGLANLTLDGVSLVANSVGLLAIGRSRVMLDNVTIKRFATGMTLRGGFTPRFTNLYIENCTTGADFRGDQDALFTNEGGELQDVYWDGGRVSECSTVGLRVSYEDMPVWRTVIRSVRFFQNTGPAVLLNGPRMTTFDACYWEENTDNLDVRDDTDAAANPFNQVHQLIFRECYFGQGTNTFNGLCEDVRFDGCELVECSFDLSVPTNPILIKDCEERDITIGGTTDRFSRTTSFQTAQFPGVTTNSSWTTAYQLSLEPGSVVIIRARVVGRGRNTTNKAAYEVRATFARAEATLTFNAASATLSPGTSVTGATSGAKALVVAVSGTTSGTVTLRDITGAFINGETLNFSDAKTASATGTLGFSSTVAQTQDTVTYFESNANWNVQTAASGALGQVQVRGDTSEVVEWVVEVDMLRT